MLISQLKCPLLLIVSLSLWAVSLLDWFCLSFTYLFVGILLYSGYYSFVSSTCCKYLLQFHRLPRLERSSCIHLVLMIHSLLEPRGHEVGKPRPHGAYSSMFWLNPLRLQLSNQHHLNTRHVSDKVSRRLQRHLTVTTWDTLVQTA